MSERTNSKAIFRRIRAKNFLLSLTALLIIVGLAATALAFLSDGPTTVSSAPTIKTDAQPTPRTQSSSEADRLEAVVISLRARGFEPAEITRPRGRFILVVSNKSWLEEVELRLEREDGSRVREVRRRRNKPNWREVVDLPPGQYVLKEANNPGWACRITITPR